MWCIAGFCWLVFCSGFGIFVYQGYRSVDLSLLCLHLALVLGWYWLHRQSQEGLPPFLIVWESLCRIGVSSCPNFGRNSAVKSSNPGLVFVDRNLITGSICILAIGLFRLWIASWFSFGRLYTSRNLSIYSWFLSCWHIVACCISRLFYVCLRNPLLYFLFYFWFYRSVSSHSFLWLIGFVMNLLCWFSQRKSSLNHWSFILLF